MSGPKTIPAILRSLALLALLLLSAGAGGRAEEPASLAVQMLDADLGDPASPHSFKLAVDLPPMLSKAFAAPAPEQIEVYVFPADLADADGVTAEWKSGLTLAWVRDNRLWLDVRRPPRQPQAGTCAVLVRLLSGEVVLAQGRAATLAQASATRADVVLVIDTSQSMKRSDPYKKRVDAARAFLELAAGGGISGIGVVGFSTDARVLAPLTSLDDKDTLLNALRQIDADGMTDMDRALEEADAVLQQSQAARRAVVFLTDGRNEPHAYRDTHQRFAAAGVPVFTIGLSDHADAEQLQRMAQETGGRFAAAATDRDLLPIYQRLAQEIGRRAVLLTKSVDEPLCELDLPVDASVRRMGVLLSAAPEASDLALVGPGGASWHTGEAAAKNEPGQTHLQVAAPESGAWRLAVRGASADDPYALTVSAETDLFLDLFPPQLDDNRLTLAATLAGGGDLLPGSRVRVLDADERLVTELFDDGQHEDGRAGDGVFAGSFRLPRELQGELALHLVTWGSSPGGDFRRQLATSFERPAVATAPQPEPAPEFTTRLIARPIEIEAAVAGQSIRRPTRLTLLAEEALPLRVQVAALTGEAGTIAAERVRLHTPAAGAPLAPGETDAELAVDLPRETQPGVYEGSLRLNLPDAEAILPVRLTVSPALLNAPESIDLGQVRRGDTRHVGLELLLDAPCDLPLTAANDPQKETLRLIDPPATLTPGTPTRLPLRVKVSDTAPAGAGQETLTIAVGPAERTVRVQWSVVAPAVVLEEDPELLDTPGPQALQAPVLDEPETRPEPRPDDLAAVPEIPELPDAGEDAPPSEEASQDSAAAEQPSTGDSAESATVPVPLSQDEAARQAWESIRPYVFWILLLGILLLGLAIVLVRLLVRDRMARFATLSVLIHAVLVLLAADVMIIVEPDTPLLPQPRMVAHLVAIKQDLGLQLSEAEEELLRQVRAAEIDEQRFETERAARPEAEVAKETPALETMPAPTLAHAERRENREHQVDELARRFEFVRQPTETMAMPELTEARKVEEPRRDRPELEPAVEIDAPVTAVEVHDALQRRAATVTREAARLDRPDQPRLQERVALAGPRRERADAHARDPLQPQSTPELVADSSPAPAATPAPGVSLPAAVEVSVASEPIAAAASQTLQRTLAERPVEQVQPSTLPARPAFHSEPRASLTAPEVALERSAPAVQSPRTVPDLLPDQLPELPQSSPSARTAVAPAPAAASAPAASIDVAVVSAEAAPASASVTRARLAPDFEMPTAPAAPTPAVVSATALRATGPSAMAPAMRPTRQAPHALSQNPDQQMAAPGDLPALPTARRPATASAPSRAQPAPAASVLTERQPSAALPQPVAKSRAATSTTAETAPSVTKPARLDRADVTPATTEPTRHIAVERLNEEVLPQAPAPLLPTERTATRQATPTRALPQSAGIDTAWTQTSSPAVPETRRTAPAAANPVALMPTTQRVSPGRADLMPLQTGLGDERSRPVERDAAAPTAAPNLAVERRPVAAAPASGHPAAPEADLAAGRLPAEIPSASQPTARKVAGRVPGAPMPSSGLAVPETAFTPEAVSSDSLGRITRRATSVAGVAREGAAPAAPAELQRPAAAPAAAVARDAAPVGSESADRFGLAPAPVAPQISVERRTPAAVSQVPETAPTRSVEAATARERVTPTFALPAEPRSVEQVDNRFGTGTEPGALTIVVGETRFGSDWNSSPLAVANLVDTFRRRVAADLQVEKRTVGLNPKDVADCQLLFLTGNLPFAFSPEEAATLRTYLAAGGFVWINDSSREGDDRFDGSVRREVQRALGKPFKRVAVEHPLFRSAYDFSTGYLGYAIPPGDKYRLDYVEGIESAGRLALLYTRNDYADGMALDPTLNPVRPSLTDLSAEMMQEGALRFGINVITFAIGGEGRTLLADEGSAELKQDVALDPQRLIPWEDFNALTPDRLAWQPEPWSNPAELGLAPDGLGGQALQIGMGVGQEHKVAIKTDIPERGGQRLDLTLADSIVLDIYNGHSGGFRCSLLLSTVGPDGAWHDFETPHVYLRPRWNRQLRFALRDTTFKSDLTGWTGYDSPLQNAQACGKITLVLYNRGEIAAPILLDNLALEAMADQP